MSNVKQIYAHTGTHPEAFYKTTLFQSDRLLLGLNCLEPGQTQAVHAHLQQDKFYFVVEGQGSFTIGDREQVVGKASAVWAPAGVEHGVANRGDQRLVLLVGIAPAPGS